MKKIKNVIFDLGGVLADLNRERCEVSFRALGLDGLAELINPYYPAAILLDLEYGRARTEALHDYVLGRWGVDVPTERIAEAYNSFVGEIAAWKLDYIGALRREGYKVFMLSNTSDVIFSEVRRREFTGKGLAVEDYFDKLYLSYEMGMMKPHREIFDALVADSGIVPGESLFIDDGEKNIAAARECGFVCYHAAAGEDYRMALNNILMR